MTTTRNILLVFLMINCIFHVVYAQSEGKIVVSGYVKELGSNEFLESVNIRLANENIGTMTNKYGFYSLTIPVFPDSLTLIFSSVGYTTSIKKITGSQNIILDVFLEKADVLLKEVEISSDAAKALTLNSLNINTEQLKTIPLLLGEKDIIKAFQLMPGVQKGADGSSALYVRGGGQDQNLLILDDAVVYNAYHAFGLFSVFNNDAVKSVELVKGGFPARYGGRLSSVLNIQMKEGNKEKLRGTGSIGLLSSKLTLEGPIKQGKSSYLLSGRRTYFDFFTKPLMSDNFNFGYYFYDINLKANHEFNRNNKLYLSAYLGKDKIGIKEKNSTGTGGFGMEWNSLTTTLRWNHLFNEKLFSNVSLIFSDYKFKLSKSNIKNATKETPQGEEGFSYQSSIQDVGIKSDFDFLPNANHNIKFGVLLTKHFMNPNTIFDNNSRESKPRTDTDNALETTEGGIYLEDNLKIGEALVANIGIRGAYFQTGQKAYFNPEPRISIQYKPKDSYLLQLSYARMNQYVHLLSNSGIGFPTDMWIPSTVLVRPQTSDLITLGFTKNIIENTWTISLEGYYKQMYQILSLKEGTSFLRLNKTDAGLNIKYESDSWESKLTQGKGWSYGGEILIQKNLGKLTGWLGYTLSWIYHQFDDINNGEAFHPRQDRRHDISLVGTYKLSPKITISANWIYGTGQATTPPQSSFNGSFNVPGFTFQSNATNIITYPARGSVRLPDYHRLDVGIQFHKQKKRWKRTWEISIVNLYNRQNPTFLYYDNLTQNGSTNELKQIVLMPIIPSINYSFTF